MQQAFRIITGRTKGEGQMKVDLEKLQEKLCKEYKWDKCICCPAHIEDGGYTYTLTGCTMHDVIKIAKEYGDE